MKHRFILDSNGEIDDWRVDSGYCNGPECTRCNLAFCKHCNPNIYIEECPGDRYQRAGQLALFGEDVA